MLTSMDIHNKEFPVKMRGYDQDSVNEFLEQVIKDYEQLIRERSELSRDLDLANERLASFEQMQESLNKSIIVAQEAADRLKENSNKESDMIIQEAQGNANQLLQEAVDKARKIDEETEDLRKQSRVFRQRLQLLIESQLDLVNSDDWDNVLAAPELKEANVDTIEEVEKELNASAPVEDETEKETSESNYSEFDDELEFVDEEQVEDGHRPAIENDEPNN